MPKRRRSRTSSSAMWYPPPSRPLAADGIKARSRRGDIGETWWSRRFIEVLESFDMGARLGRGKFYARRGQVLSLDVQPGEVRATVQGSRAKPYEVGIRTLTLSKKDWSRAEKALAARAVFLAKLLSGEMPQHVEEAFSECRLSLFPASPGDLVTDCSCPDWANPCKHVAATYFLLAEAFDRDPFLIFRWRGRDRDDLLDRLRARRGGSAGGEDSWMPGAPAAGPLDATDFWRGDEALDGLRADPRPDPSPASILLELGASTIEVRGRALGEVLAPAYEVFARAASELALREREADV